MLRDKLAKFGISVQHSRDGEQKVICPECSATRRKKNEPCLNVKFQNGRALWNCKHCGWVGSVGLDNRREDKIYMKNTVKPDKNSCKSFDAAMFPQKLAEYFALRRISVNTLVENSIGRGEHFIPALGAKASAIEFPYYRDGELINVKYRTKDKHFAQVKDAEKILYGLDHIKEADVVIWVEGEIDKLSFYEVGVKNCVSIPDGAPQKLRDSLPDEEDDNKFAYMWTCKSYFEGKQHVIAVDSDEKGKILAEELARRLGKENCHLVDFSQVDGCKDANDVLTKHGAQTLIDLLDSAKPYPIGGLYSVEDYRQDFVRYFNGDMDKWLSTGWSNVDEYLHLYPGKLVICTGVPTAGKSELWDAIAVNMARLHGIKTALCSFEHSPAEHIAKLIEKFSLQSVNPGSKTRISEDEVLYNFNLVNRYFCFIRSDEDSPTVDWIVQTARAAVLRYGIKLLIIDPYNCIEHRRGAATTETEYISEILYKLKKFAEHYGVLVVLVAHPTKPDKSVKDWEPVGYDISGGANWFNKADYGLTVWRKKDDDTGDIRLNIWKVKYKWFGKTGYRHLNYDTETGTYRDNDTGVIRAEQMY